MLTRIRKAQAEREGGFTLIELLVVVIIIGILAAIAIPTFLNQREKAWERAAKSDLRNAATVVEEQFSDTGSYAGATGWKTSDDVTLTLESADNVAYCLQAVHGKLTAPDDTFHLNSADGKVANGGC
ncbi:MAG TPA: prepilin-type N-terminal cleavage/methylation domain-containing protein [Frankiaceae bacterium]|jgi:type IV pilus assembly protein PilA|nr:prepilin-type N-terminal cleavage/methylation domain-containing protein [Frankiaceae bacterium]